MQGDTGTVVVYNENVDVTNGATLVVTGSVTSANHCNCCAHDVRTTSSLHLQYLQEQKTYQSPLKQSGKKNNCR